MRSQSEMCIRDRRWIWANGGPYGTKPDGHAEIRTDGKVPYAYIRNSYIMQKLEDFRCV